MTSFTANNKDGIASCTYKDNVQAAETAVSRCPYPLIASSQVVRDILFQKCGTYIPAEFREYVSRIRYVTTRALRSEAAFFPCPMKEQETAVAIKALEGCAAAAIADLRFRPGTQRRDRIIEVDVHQAGRFLMSAYLISVNGMGKATHPEEVRQEIPQTDLHHAQSNLYRRLSAGLYETKTPGQYYHVHGSLEATTTLRMIGLPAFQESLTGYRECINTIEGAVKRFTVAELDVLNVRNRQAGFPVLEWDEFKDSSHGRAIAEQPPFTVEHLELSTPPVPFSAPRPGPPPGCLEGIRVLELCRVIAGPTIGRSLAAHGASVLKVTSPNLPDVPFFQLDVNIGKHTTALDLRNSQRDRAVFEDLLSTADVFIDGYRPGALAKLGYGPRRLTELARRRGRGFVYVAEDCFGQVAGDRKDTQPHPSPATNGATNHDEGGGGSSISSGWSRRRGWQQVADCATGAAWAQGRFMGLSEPVVPPFPMSDYGTGALGCVATMIGLWRRATVGGSWACRTSLCQYDAFVMSLGLLPPEVQSRLREATFSGDADGFEGLRHHDSVDEVGRRALVAMERAWPGLFAGPDGLGPRKDEVPATMCSAWSPGFGVDGKGAQVRWPKEAVRVTGLSVGHVRPPRPNGFDRPSWEELEEDVDTRLLG